MINKSEYYIQAKENFPDLMENPLANRYIEDLLTHVILVNEFAGKLGLEYSNHDMSKISLLLPGYMYSVKEELTNEEQNMLNFVTTLHVTQTPHHPEYWYHGILEEMTNNNYVLRTCIEVPDMTEEAIQEMVCDWCAHGKRDEIDIRDWYFRAKDAKWKFLPDQHNFIITLFDTLLN